MLDIPTAVSQLSNDADYSTTAEVTQAIADAIGQVNSFDLRVVQTLPTENISTHTIYFVPKTGEINDIYDEYIRVDNGWEMIGNTQIDLSNYATKSELPVDISDLNNDVGYITSSSLPTRVSDLIDDSGHYTKPVTGIPASDLASGVVPVQDVTVNGSSVVNVNGIAVMPIASGASTGLTQYATNGEVKTGTNDNRSITPNLSEYVAFYGLASAAGDTTTKAVSGANLGVYTAAAQTAIKSMLGVQEGLKVVRLI